MDDALIESKQRFAKEFVSNRKLDIEPVVADQWVTISLLQKSIRRGEVETTQRAAFTLFAQKGSAIWRRFIVIAFEDVGAAYSQWRPQMRISAKGHVSALPPKADMCSALAHVCFGPKADIPISLRPEAV
jgi:replication-associated recombination protein RarA